MKVRGKALMIRVNGATVALATNCVLDVTLQTLDARTKSDDGACEVGEFISFTLTSESVVGKNPGTPQHTQSTLMELLRSMQPVDVEVMLAANAALAVPGTDWAPGMMALKGFQSYGGKALVKQVTTSGDVSGDGKLSVQLGGQGALVPIAEPELTSYVEGNTLYVNGPAEIVNNSLDVEGVTINDNTIEI